MGKVPSLAERLSQAAEAFSATQGDDSLRTISNTYKKDSRDPYTIEELCETLKTSHTLLTYDQKVAALRAATRGLAALLEPKQAAALVAIAKAQAKNKAKRDELGRWAEWWCAMPLPDPTAQSQ